MNFPRSISLLIDRPITTRWWGWHSDFCAKALSVDDLPNALTQPLKPAIDLSEMDFTLSAPVLRINSNTRFC